MRNRNLSLAVLTTALLLSTSATQARTELMKKISGKTVKETLLTTKKEAITDPYFQIKSMKVKELTEEESMEFINISAKNVSEVDEDGNSIIKNNINKGNGNNNGNGKNNGGPKIPPVPPSVDLGDLVAAGGGGNTPAPSPKGFFEGVIMVVDKLIAIGEKIMPTIEKGRAVVNNNPMASVSVLPRLDTKDPVVHDMGNWSLPVTKHYKISYTNGLGSEVVSFVYSVSFQYNGNYEGKGKYLTGIRASARNITISWGFDLDAASQLIQISNVGSSSNVVAGATLEISYTVKNWTRNITTATSFFVTGDGKLYKLD